MKKEAILSVVNCQFIRGFQYDPSKTDEVKAKYDVLLETPEQGITRKLKRKDSQN